MSFQKPSDLVTLLIGDGRQELIGGIVIAPQDSGLIFDKRQGQRKAENSHILVGYIDSVVSGDVTEEVHRSTLMGDGQHRRWYSIGTLSLTGQSG